MANANSPIPTTNYTSDKQPNSSTAVATNPTSAVVGDYLVSSKIGQGSFATVFKAVHKTTRRPVAIKSVLKQKLTRKLFENLESEISILKAIRHDHIVGLIDIQKTDTHIHLIMEYCSMGDLSQYIKRKKSKHISRGPAGGLSEDVVRHFLKQLTSALEFLRSQNLVHRDIKPQNLLLVPVSDTPDNEDGIGFSNLPRLKVADFGFARILPSSSLADTLCGSPLYMGPEILSYKKYDAKADLWSVGAVVFEMITGRPPFRASNHVELLKIIEENDDRIVFPDERASHSRPSSLGDGKHESAPTGPIISDELKDLIRHLLKKNPVERISFEEFFMHPAITQGRDSIPQSALSLQAASALNDQRRSKASSLERPTITPLQISNAHREDEVPPFATVQTTPLNAKPYYVEQDRYHQLNSAPVVDTLATARRRASNDNVGLKLVAQEGRMYSQPVNVMHSENDPQSRPSSRRQSYSPRIESNFDDLQQTKERYPPNATSQQRARRDGNAESDVLDEYVVLDRKTIENNQFADELDASPRTIDEPDRNGRVVSRNKIHRLSSSPLARPASISQRTPSPQQSSLPRAYEHFSTSPPNSLRSYTGTTPPFAIPRERNSSTGSSGGSALARALSMASVRLFGTGNSPPNWNQPTTGGVAFGTGGSNPEEDAIIKQIEDAACKAHAVAQFADSKFVQIQEYNDTSPHPESLQVPVLAEEAMVLYIKALALLESGMKIAKDYWARVSSTEPQQGQPRVAPVRLNSAVQWMRERFNECLDRASYAKNKCEDENAVNACVEKLLYDRALEMSRAAAVNELVGENIAGCERDYKIGIYMLEAILEDEEQVMEEDDRRIINKFVESIKNRLNVLLKKKAAMPQQQQQIPSSNTSNV
ncbi:kinase-like domain-containing protein [Umbelopsis sp. AD052]|nr:kinase-like domain-containing protein [Umbelopsis sp. AD052]